MAQFKPIMVENKDNLQNVNIVDGQYIVVMDKNELYLDKAGKREKVSQNVYIQADEPTNMKTGDIWLVTEE